MPELIIQVIITVVSFVYQQQQQARLKRKMEAEADKRKGFMIPTRGQAAYIPVIYGKQATGGIETAHKTKNSFNNYNNNSDETFSEDFSNSAQAGSKNEFLFVQAALCHDNIQSVKTIYVNDTHYDEEKSKFNHRFTIHHEGGTADAMATANGFSNKNKFTNCAFVTSAYKLNRDDPQYSGIPSPLYLIKGKKVKPINLSGGNYSLGSRSYSNNPALCLLDYLLDSDYGRGLSLSQVDLPSFHHAMQVCATTVTTRTVGGRINDVDPILTFSNFSSFPNEGESGIIYKDENSGVFYKWDTSVNPDAYVQTTVNTQNIPLYECNITLDTEAKLRDNIEKIMNTMGLAELIWSSEGKYKLLLEYPSSQTALNNLVNSSHVFNENNIIRENVTIGWPSASDRFNQSTVTFINEFEDFKEDSETWPPTGSSVHNTYLSEDNNQPFTGDLNLEGITTPYHARAKAEQLVRQSREMRTLKVTLDKAALTLEPGDFIKLTSDNLDISNEIFRVTSVSVNSDLTVEIEAYLFTINMLAWNINDDIAYAQKPVFDFTLESVTNVTSTPGFFVNNDGTLTHYIDVEWDHPGSFSYEIRYKKNSEPVSSYISVNTRLQYYRILNIENNTSYNIQVRAISSLGTGSNFETISDSNNGKNTPPNRPSGLSATGLFEAIELNWTNPSDKDLRTIQIWESSNSNIGNASLISTTPGSSFYRGNLGISQTRYYWVRAEDSSGNFSSYRGPVNATTTFIDDNAFETGIRDLFEDQGLYAIEDVASLPSTGATGQQVFNRADGKLYRWNGTAWELVIASVEAADIDGTLTNAQIDALAASKITGQLTNAQLADIAAAKVSGQLTNSQLADIAAAKITGTITETQISDNAITTDKINANAIDASKIVANSITAGQLAADSVTASEISAGSVSANKIAADAITADKIAANAVEAASIKAGAVVAGKIATDAVTANTIAADAVTANKIAANAVTADSIAADTITGDKIAANTITSGLVATSGLITNSAQINNGLITNAKIANAAITTAKIGDGEITNAKIGNTIQSTNYNSGSAGWKINKNGSAEFNGVVISRQLQVDSGTLNVGTTQTIVYPVMAILGIFYVESTSVPMSAWAGAKKTYLANAGLSGTVVSTGGAPPDVFWGWRVIVLPLTRWSGSQTLRLRLELWGKNVSQVTNLKANWKIYEVT